MLTGEIRSKIDALWNAFWTGGISQSLFLDLFGEPATNPKQFQIGRAHV